VLNSGLEARVAEQVEELGRIGRLKRFLAPQLAELIVSQGNEKILESHPCEIVVVFCDLRGYTAFTETAEPEEVLESCVNTMLPWTARRPIRGNVDQFSGDAIMVFFNDPVPIPGAAARGQHGGGDARGSRHADRRLARDARPDRVLRALRLYGDRHGVQCRRASLR
jgi:class 3 adenylate cyclase